MAWGKQVASNHNGIDWPLAHAGMIRIGSSGSILSLAQAVSNQPSAISKTPLACYYLTTMVANKAMGRENIGSTWISELLLRARK